MADGSSARSGALFIGRRLIASVLTVVILSLVVFVLIKAIPGDEAHVAAGESATPQQVAQVRHELGLDRSIFGQLGSYLDRLAHGNLGISTSTHTAVAKGIEQVLPQTLELVVLATVLMIIIFIPAAIFAAYYRDRREDVLTRFAVLSIAAIPTFWLALELQYLLAAKWQIFPISGPLSRNFFVPRRTGSTMLDALLDGQLPAFWDSFQHFLLPAVILMIPFGAALFRTTRAEMNSVLSRDHITVAKAKGLPTLRLVLRHGVPNAMGPALTVIGIEFGNMVGAAVLVEAVFGLNGMGSYLTTAVGNKDTFAVLGGVLVIGVIVVMTSFVVDILQLVRDPRIRSAQAGV